MLRPLQYRKTAKELIDWICDYYARVESLPVRSEVEPGYLPPMLPRKAPDAPEAAEAVLSDIQSKIMPGELQVKLLLLAAHSLSARSISSLTGTTGAWSKACCRVNHLHMVLLCRKSCLCSTHAEACLISAERVPPLWNISQPRPTSMLTTQ